MQSVVVMSAASIDDVVPGLALVPVPVRLIDRSLTAASSLDPGTIALIDARTDLVAVRSLCRSIAATMPDVVMIAVMTEGGMSAVLPDWGLADVVLPEAGPAELHARLRLAHLPGATQEEPEEPDSGASDLVIDASGYSARLRGEPLDLTYKEFELLRFLAASPGRVMTRQQILDEVWGDDYYGGTRTVDVHVRRLRAKLGPENEALIGTVRNVGYRYTV